MSPGSWLHAHPKVRDAIRGQKPGGGALRYERRPTAQREDLAFLGDYTTREMETLRQYRGLCADKHGRIGTHGIAHAELVEDIRVRRGQIGDA